MEDEACICGGLRRAARALTRRYDDALSPVGLTVTQFSILRTLDRLDGPSLAGLAEATAHEKSALWRLLRPLVRQGLVAVQTPAGGRGQRLSTTGAGQARLAAALPHWRAVQTHVADTMGGREAALIALLREIETDV